MLKNDRLEPNQPLHDVGKFEDLRPNPTVKVLFWRMSKETRTRHRNPLFDPALGITHRLFNDDKLHYVYLGVCGFFVQTALWLLLTANVFNVKGPWQGSTRNQ